MKTTLIIVGSLLAVVVIGFVVYKQMHKGGATSGSSDNANIDLSGGVAAGVAMGRNTGKKK